MIDKIRKVLSMVGNYDMEFTKWIKNNNTLTTINLKTIINSKSDFTTLKRAIVECKKEYLRTSMNFIKGGK
jgi:hypothetical protein